MESISAGSQWGPTLATQRPDPSTTIAQLFLQPVLPLLEMAVSSQGYYSSLKEFLASWGRIQAENKMRPHLVGTGSFRIS
jgi:hypothetical protein